MAERKWSWELSDGTVDLRGISFLCSLRNYLDQSNKLFTSNSHTISCSSRHVEPSIEPVISRIFLFAEQQYDTVFVRKCIASVLQKANSIPDAQVHQRLSLQSPYLPKMPTHSHSISSGCCRRQRGLHDFSELLVSWDLSCRRNVIGGDCRRDS